MNTPLTRWASIKWSSGNIQAILSTARDTTMEEDTFDSFFCFSCSQDFDVVDFDVVVVDAKLLLTFTVVVGGGVQLYNCTVLCVGSGVAN